MIEITHVNGSVIRTVDAETLSGANLIGANLIGANLSGVNLSGADLIGANLRGADLSRADLIGANLRGADLSRADLIGANLRGADLSRAVGNMREVRSAQIVRWPIVWTADKLWIGCQCKPISEWWTIRDEDVLRMDSHGLDLWKRWMPLIRMMVEASFAES